MHSNFTTHKTSGSSPYPSSLKGCIFSTAITLASLVTGHAQTAGIDFDSGGPFTEAGFLSVPATGSKDYNVTHNGVTFDIDGTSELGNQNRLRGSGADVNNDLTRDSIQWYSSNDGTILPEAPITNGNQGFHWNQNGETMFLIGDAMGREMVDLVSAP